MRTQAGTDAVSEKARGLLIDFLAYAVAFIAAGLLSWRIGDPLIATAVFTGTATLLVYVVSVLYADVSVYDPYWSVAPPVMLIANILKYKLFNINAVILLLLVGVWAFRLTANWYSTYRGVGHEDWRYAQYRERLSPLAFQFVSFFGLHFVPTVVVYGGMVSALLAIRQEHFALLSVAGAAVMLLAVNLEYVSDKAIHDFLREHGEERRTCDVSVWKYSRHPNYLGEMLFWTGLYLYYLPLHYPFVLPGFHPDDGTPQPGAAGELRRLPGQDPGPDSLPPKGNPRIRKAQQSNGHNQNRFHAGHAVPEDALAGPAQAKPAGHPAGDPGPAGRRERLRRPGHGHVRPL